VIKNADVDKDYADFANNFYIFKNYMLRAIFMPNFRSLAHPIRSYSKGGKGRGGGGR